MGTVHPCQTGGLGAWDQVGCYCERALDGSFWAEPLNALSNIAFLIAAVMAYADWRARSPQRGQVAIGVLIVLTMAIGVGSFLFHTLATIWARAADAIPIALFVLAYLYIALRWFLGVGAIVAFLLALALAVAVASQFMPPWFNGSFGYAPPLLALLIVGLVLQAREHGAARWVLGAGGIFALSLVFRTIDAGAGCFVHPPGAVEPDFIIGTHPLWHILNGLTLWLLLRAVIEYGAPQDQDGI